MSGSSAFKCQEFRVGCWSKQKLFLHYQHAKITQSICSIHQIICEIHLILESNDLKGFVHLWPCPPSNYSSKFWLSYICISILKISSFHQFIYEKQQVLEIHDLRSHDYFCPQPPKISWICINSLFDSFLLEIQPILESCDHSGHTHFDHAHPYIFKSTFNFHKLVSICKNAGLFIIFFLRDSWFKNPGIWLAKSILPYISGI